MIRRFVPFLSLLWLCTAPPALAQTVPERPEILSVRNARLSLTPILGVRSPLVSQRRNAVVIPGVFRPVAVVFEAQPSDGGVAGAELELHLGGRFGVAGAVVFGNPDAILATVETREGLITQTFLEGPSVWFARTDLVYELLPPRPDTRDYRPAAFLMLGPALVSEDYGDGVLALSEGDNRIENWALHAGAKGVFPFGPSHLALYLSFEDYATFWNPRDQERERVERLLDLQPGTILNTAFDYNTTHVLMLNLGLSLRI